MRLITCVAFCAALLLSNASSLVCFGQQPAKGPVERKPVAKKASTTDERSVIRQGSEDFEKAFNAGNAKSIAALWTVDGEYVDETGQSFSGRDAIEAGYESFFANNPKAKIQVLVDSLRLLNDSTALEDGRTIVTPPPADAPGIGKYTAIHVKVDGKWYMSTVRDTRIETPSNYRNLSDLEWLIGTWTAEEFGLETTSVCRWVANKSFVERRYTITHSDGTTASGVQMIGWNPANGNVQSWNFSPDGGHAVGIWAQKENGWVAEIHGVSGNGIPTHAVNLLTRLDDGAYTWQSINRSIGGAMLTDTDEVVLKRQSDEQ